jgi:kanamycin kinase
MSVPATGDPPPVPAAVRELAGDEVLRLVWHNEVGGLTYEIGSGPRRRFVKWTPHGSGIDLSAEAARLRWAGRFHPVPHVLGDGHDDPGSWLVTAAIAGENAIAPRWLAEPRRAAVGIGEGLRALHDALPVADCPFSWQANDRIADACSRAAAAAIDPTRWHPHHRHLSVDSALRALSDVPPIDRLVVCHGDSCAPNTLLDDAGRWCAHVDLGTLGVADRWADLAVATWSTTWNYGTGYERVVLDAYGVAPDEERTRYYRLLWDLEP